MRLLSGADLEGGTAAIDETAREWTRVLPGAWLEEVLAEMRDPEKIRRRAADPDLKAELRPYQQTGVNWLWFMYRLGLGACLSDDMGLGKTVQVLALLLQLKRERSAPSLLVVPASLIANWKEEIRRFAPSLAATKGTRSVKGKKAARPKTASPKRNGKTAPAAREPAGRKSSGPSRRGTATRRKMPA